MARKKRYHIPGAFYHVMLRGNDGQAIFFSDEERYHMCLLIQEGIERFGHRIHSFCLMGNHIHLLIQVKTIPLSKIIHNFTFRYCQFINRRYKKIGHLFQGRFKAILIQEDAYFLRLLRYIHMNPVRAHLVQEPASYFWSSHRTYLGQGGFDWLTTEYGLKKFSDRVDDARLQYREYVLVLESDDCLKELRQGGDDGQILGDDNFLEEVRNAQTEDLSKKNSLEAILKAVCKVYTVELTSLESPIRSAHLSFVRGAATTLARENGYSLEEMAKVFKRDATSLGRLMQRFMQKYALSEDIQKSYHCAEEMVSNFAVMQA